MSEQELSTGQAMGATKIPLRTMQRYIRDFGEFFSESARLTTRGRRFSLQDMDNLLMIRHLYYQRFGKDKIRAALRGEWAPPAKEQYNNQDALALVGEARQYMTEAVDHARRAEQWAKRAETTIESARHLLHQFRKVVDNSDRAAQLEIELQALKDRLQAIEKAMPKQAEDQRKRRGFLW